MVNANIQNQKLLSKTLVSNSAQRMITMLYKEMLLINQLLLELMLVWTHLLIIIQEFIMLKIVAQLQMILIIAFLLLDMESILLAIHHIGLWKTHGEPVGELKDISWWKEVMELTQDCVDWLQLQFIQLEKLIWLLLEFENKNLIWWYIQFNIYRLIYMN